MKNKPGAIIELLTNWEQSSKYRIVLKSNHSTRKEPQTPWNSLEDCRFYVRPEVSEKETESCWRKRKSKSCLISWRIKFPITYKIWNWTVNGTSPIHTRISALSWFWFMHNTHRPTSHPADSMIVEIVHRECFFFQMSLVNTQWGSRTNFSLKVH